MNTYKGKTRGVLGQKMLLITNTGANTEIQILVIRVSFAPAPLDNLYEVNIQNLNDFQEDEHKTNVPTLYMS